MSIFALLLLLEVEHVLIVASIGAGVFIAFAKPGSSTAQRRSAVERQVVGLIAGSLCTPLPHRLMVSSAAVYALAVGKATLVMVLTGTRHLPAARKALGVALSGFSLSVSISVITSAIVLALFHKLLKHRLTGLE